MQAGDIGRERGEPFALEASGGGINQQRGADLHNDAPEVLERRRFLHCPDRPVHGGAV
jgi:hypothetical protein